MSLAKSYSLNVTVQVRNSFLLFSKNPFICIYMLYLGYFFYFNKKLIIVDFIVFHQMGEEIVIQDLLFNHHSRIEIKEVLATIMVPLQHQILLFLEVVVILVVEEVHLVEEEAQVEVEVLYQEEVAVDLQEEKTTNNSLV